MSAGRSFQEKGSKVVLDIKNYESWFEMGCCVWPANDFDRMSENLIQDDLPASLRPTNVVIEETGIAVLPEKPLKFWMIMDSSFINRFLVIQFR